ncbi:MAG: diacylglycerol kinase family lipid kinase [Gemmatimonadetes bacterium]|nr:diacylglycerol kinase family lipid kinase [Gemmatimonadota bacterium]
MSSSHERDAVGPFADRIFIVLNPTAGQDAPARLRRAIGRAFAARGALFDLVETRYAGHATELTRVAVMRGYRAVCVVGGDGTIAEAATALAGTEVPLALIPRGTANQLARNLKIPTRLDAAVEVATRGAPTPMDLGRIDGRAFALVAGAGYDAAVMATATRPLKDRWGFAAYVYAAVKAAIHATPARFHVVADGREVEVSAVSVMIANIGELFTAFLPFGLPLVPHPARSWQDGLLDVLVVAPRNLPDLAAVLWRAARRKFSGDDRLLHFQAREVWIQAEPVVPVEIDGDTVGETPVTASVLRQGIRVLTPGG